MNKELWQSLYSIIKWDFVIMTRRKGDLMIPIFFFMMVCTILPLSQNLPVSQLKEFAAGILWIACVLSLLLSFGIIYQENYKEGTLEQLLICPIPLSWLLLGKAIAQGLLLGIPLLLMAILFGILMNLSTEAVLVLIASFVFGVPIMILMASIGIALTIHIQKNSLLLAILMLPLWIPVIILGTTSVFLALQNISYTSELCLMAALCILCILLLPKVIAFTLRESIS